MTTPQKPEKPRRHRPAPPAPGAGAGVKPKPVIHPRAPGTKASPESAMHRADALLRRMTIEEKVMQLSAVMPFALLGPEGPIKSQLDAQLKHGVGHVSGLGLFGHKSPATVAKTVNAIQRYLVTETRLKIPAIFHNEALNGVVSAGFTHFPTSIGLAATWDPDGVQEMADLMRRQMRARSV